MLGDRLLNANERAIAIARFPADIARLTIERATLNARMHRFEPANELLARAAYRIECDALHALDAELAFARGYIAYLSRRVLDGLEEIKAARAAAIDQPILLARIDGLLSLILCRLGVLDAAERVAERALACAQATDDDRALYHAWMAVGACHRSHGNDAPSYSAYMKASKYARDLDDELSQTAVLHHLVGLTVERLRRGTLTTPKQLEAAEREIEAAERFAERHDTGWGMVQARVVRGMIEAAAQRHHAAVEALNCALPNAIGVRSWEETVWGYVCLARSLVVLSRLDRAETASKEALRVADMSSAYVLRLGAREARVEFLRSLGREHEAAILHREVESLREHSAREQHQLKETIELALSAADLSHAY
ncbi:MAG TPA: hypothetical protein VFS42_03855 [Burkholderiaceae bacterium]|nr:hypothetical protein [Burkholderiaceae bacterium]